MNLDHEGNWIDPGPIGEQYGLPHPQGVPPTLELILDPSLSPDGIPNFNDGQTRPLPPIEADLDEESVEYLPSSFSSVRLPRPVESENDELLRLPPLADE
jgi:hypothetical protein